LTCGCGGASIRYIKDMVWEAAMSLYDAQSEPENQWSSIDFMTLITVLIVALLVSVLGVFGYSVEILLPNILIIPVYAWIAFSSVWQFYRQKFL